MLVVSIIREQAMRYRRLLLPGCRWFFTAVLAQRSSALLTENIHFLRQAFRAVKQTHPFTIDAIVILPDHLHTIWTLPSGDVDFPLRWSLIKSHFSRHISKGEFCGASRRYKGERGIWQRRYWEHGLRDEPDWQHHVDYIHYNPVKHGYVLKAVDWPFSSLHLFIRRGILPADWGA